MVFSSPTFIFLFFPAVFLTCLLTRRSVKWSNAVLLIFSLLFYAWGEPVYVLLMAFTTLVCYICARMIAKGRNVRLSTAVAVIWGIGTLVVFKYTAFLVQSFNSLTHLAVPVPNIALPVGISFFTFQAISYVLDVKRGDAEAAASYADVLLYISLFPQLIAGPIVRYSDVAAEIKQRTVTTEDIAAGLRRFCFGMGKKVLIANTLAYTADKVFALDSAAINAPIAWLGAVCYLMQIYFDFPVTATWPLALAARSASHSAKTSCIPIAPHPCRIFGADGTYPFPPGSKNMFISPLAATGAASCARGLISL